MTKLARMIDVLDLYTESNALLSAEEIAERLQVSRPTAFRYARELTASGFLANYGRRYSLGARIITLDYRIRETDPILAAARAPMRELADHTRHGTILCRMYNEEIINVHHELGDDNTAVAFGRGRPLPLFRGATSKVMLACLPPRKLRRVYEEHAALADVAAIAGDWEGFRQYYAAIRQSGHYVSEGEVEPDIIGIAAPIALPGHGTIAALCLVLARSRAARADIASLVPQVMAHAGEVSEALRAVLPAGGGE